MPPFNKGAFKIEITFPAEYPFRPPKVRGSISPCTGVVMVTVVFPIQILFNTKIYHPNVDEKGQVCLPIISPENWKPVTKTDQGVSMSMVISGTCVCMHACVCVCTLINQSLSLIGDHKHLSKRIWITSMA